MVLIFQALFIPAFSYDWSFHYLLLTEGTHYSIQFLMNYFVVKYVFVLHRCVAWELTFICFCHEGGTCSRRFKCCNFFSTLVCYYWFIFILIVFPVVRWCFCIGPHRSAVVLLDHGYPSFENFDSTIPIDVFGMKSYRASLTLSVYHGVAINEHNLVPNTYMPRFLSVHQNYRSLSKNKPYVCVMFFYPF